MSLFSRPKHHGSIDDHRVLPSSAQKSQPLRSAAFRLMDLPLELRDMIYRHHLVKDTPICPVRVNNVMSSFIVHRKNCPLYNHGAPVESDEGYREDVFTCEDPFHGTRVLKIPNSALALLLASRQVFAEAMPIFYRENTFIFTPGYSMAHLRDFLRDINGRRLYLRSLTFEFSSTYAKEVFSLMRDMEGLRELRVYMNMSKKGIIPSRRCGEHNWANTRGIRWLRLFVRGIQNLVLVGSDNVYNECGRLEAVVDINDAKAYGPQLRRQLCRPRGLSASEEGGRDLMEDSVDDP